MTGWGTARLSCAPPRSVGLRVDQIAHSDHALGKDPRAQPTPVDEARHDALLREVLEVLAGLAEPRSEEHTSELQSPCNLVCRLLLEKKKKNTQEQLPTCKNGQDNKMTQ